MNKYISVKRAICICLILSCLMMCLNIYMKAYDRSNRKENLYFELLQLKFPIDTEVIKLESKQYLFGDVVLQCDFTLLPQNAFLENIQCAGWKRIDGEDMLYQKDGISLIVIKKDNFYSLQFVDCRNGFNSYLYDLPKNKF